VLKARGPFSALALEFLKLFFYNFLVLVPTNDLWGDDDLENSLNELAAQAEVAETLRAAQPSQCNNVAAKA